MLEVVTDRKLAVEGTGGGAGTVDYYTCDVVSYSDYYPYGMVMPNRSASSGDYRYGFQDQEMDDEIKGANNSLNYKYRMHDPRVGRFFAVDPLAPKYPHNSPYAFSENRVIHMKELEGLEGTEAYNYIGGEEFPVLDSEISEDVKERVGRFAGGVFIACAATVDFFLTGGQVTTVVGTAYLLTKGADNYVGIEYADDPEVQRAWDEWGSTTFGLAMGQGTNSFLTPKAPFNTQNLTGNQLGKIGERQLARNYGKGVVASPKERTLTTFTKFGKRIYDNMIDGVAYEAKVGYKTMSSGSGNSTVRAQLEKDISLLESGQIEEVVWVFYKSPKTGKGGAGKGVLDFIEAAQGRGLNIKTEMGEISEGTIDQVVKK